MAAGLSAVHALLVRADTPYLQAPAEAVRLNEQSRTDVRTGLPSRRHLDEQLVAAFDAARRDGGPLAVAMVDIDDFKRINGLFGHGAGDTVLRHVAGRPRSPCHGADPVARYAGEEFCVVPAQDRAATAPGMRVTRSIGLADSGATPQAPLAEADARLYTARREGKNRVV